MTPTPPSVWLTVPVKYRAQLKLLVPPARSIVALFSVSPLVRNNWLPLALKTGDVASVTPSRVLPPPLTKSWAPPLAAIVPPWMVPPLIGQEPWFVGLRRTWPVLVRV